MLRSRKKIHHKSPPQKPIADKQKIRALALEKEGKKFEAFYLWIENHMPPRFFAEVDQESIVLIVHTLMGFNLSGYFSKIETKTLSFTLSLESPEADCEVLKEYQGYGIKSYCAFISNAPAPFPNIKAKLRVTMVVLSDTEETGEPAGLDPSLLSEFKRRNKEVSKEQLRLMVSQLTPRFIRSMTKERLLLALEMFLRASTRDHCQYEVKEQKDWKKNEETPSLQIVLAWRNVPKSQFLYRLAKLVSRHQLSMKRVSALYADSSCEQNSEIDPLKKGYGSQNILILSIGLHGRNGKAAWEEADITDFLKELTTLKYFEGLTQLESQFVEPRLLSGNQTNLLKAITYFIHQNLAPLDPNLYALHQIEEGLCRHTDLTKNIISLFEKKFRPDKQDSKGYRALFEELSQKIQTLDTGNEMNDKRRKNILSQALSFIEYTLKNNYFRKNKTAFCFRLDPEYLNHLPYDRKEKFPELPFAVFFMKGLNFIGFHVRFRDLSRGGLRTVFPERIEQMVSERNAVFSECYQLAYTQNKKNKDIPEGGAKGVIFIEPYHQLLAEAKMFQKEMEIAGISSESIAEKLESFKQEHKLEFLYQSQRAYIENFLLLLNCDEKGKLVSKDIVDYYQKPEYIYLGPDENMHNVMIDWIAAYSEQHGYALKGAFISSKPQAGINHKEFGVTSLGVNVYVEEGLKFLKIDPKKDRFTVKMTGGPDGDVAGNQIYNLYRFYPKTAKLLTLLDGSGVIFDPEGLDLKILVDLFQKGLPIRNYPPEALSNGGFLLDTKTRKEQSRYVFHTLCYRKAQGKVKAHYLPGNEMNHLIRYTVHQTPADLFIPAGGRPRTLNETNYQDFLNTEGKPTSKLIVEGANLYITPWARRALEKLGTLVIKDSSANKGGVTCSSFEVLFSLVLSTEEFIKSKPKIVSEILKIIAQKSKEEALLLLQTHKETGVYLTEISEWISEKINSYKDQLLDYLKPLTLSSSLKDPFIECLAAYCPPFLKEHHFQKFLKRVPDTHKKAIIACYIASQIVYKKGLKWAPTLIDILPLLVKDNDVIFSKSKL